MNSKKTNTEERTNELTDDFFKLNRGERGMYWFDDCKRFQEDIAWFMDKYGGYIAGFGIEYTKDRELRIYPSATLNLREDQENTQRRRKPYQPKI